MMVINGKVYETQDLPALFFGHRKPLAYVGNPKVASTLALNFLFYLDHNYRYFDPVNIYHSPLAVPRLETPDLDPRVVRLYFSLNRETFTFVRDPLRRFVSGFLNKVFTDVDPRYLHYRDMLTCVHGIDIGPEADPRQSCLAFAKWIAAQPSKSVDPHFRLQHLNLAIGSRFTVDTILRVEDKPSMLAYFAKWIGAEKAEWFLSLRFNESVKYAHDDVTSSDLEALVRKIYARDYELFYAETAATQAENAA